MYKQSYEAYIVIEKTVRRRRFFSYLLPLSFPLFFAFSTYSKPFLLLSENDFERLSSPQGLTN